MACGLALTAVACSEDRAAVEEWVYGLFTSLWMNAGPDQLSTAAGAVSPVARPADPVYLGSSAHATGFADTNWRTDVELHNSGDVATILTVEMLLHGVGNAKPRSVDLIVRPHRSVRLEDVLLRSFGIEGKAALRVSSEGSAVIATNRTYNLLQAGNGLGLPAGATFGQYIPARDVREAIGPGERGILIQLTHDGSARTNLGFVNLTDDFIDAGIDLHRATGEKLGSVGLRLAPYEYRQLTQAFATVTKAPVPDGYAVVRVITEGGRVLAQASVIDNLTGDPVFVPAVTALPPLADARPLWIVAAAHAGGASGTNWRTDVEVMNPNPTTVAYTVELLPHMGDNSTPRSTTLTIPAGQSIRHADVLEGLFGFGGTAALRILPVGGPLIVTSRTYNLLGEGNPLGLPSGATFGQYIPALGEDAALRTGEEGRLVQLSEDATGAAGFRTNVVLVNATAAPLGIVVDLMSADGVRLASEQLVLAPREYRQLNRVFTEVAGQGVEDGYAVVRTGTPGGAFFALASVVDNLTGDPVGMSAATVRSELADGLIASTEGAIELMGGGQGLVAPVVLRDITAALIAHGINPVLDVLSAELPPGAATRTADGLLLDFGTSTDVDGRTLSGRVELVVSGVVLEPTAVRATILELHHGYAVDGVEPDLAEVRVDLDLEIRSDGSVAGTVLLEGEPRARSTADLAASAADLEGRIEIDTAVCPSYPVGGFVTLRDSAGEAATVRFGAGCDGTFEHQVDPLWDWVYSYQDPGQPAGSDHVELATNVEVRDEAVAHYWSPITGGSQFSGRGQPGDTQPGVIRYRFGFDRRIQAAHLMTCLPAYHLEPSRAQNYLLGSNDGVSWTELLEVEAPYLGSGVAGCFDADLPPGVLGARDLWIQVELYCWGPQAPEGGGACTTAQHSRFSKVQPDTTFAVKVGLAER